MKFTYIPIQDPDGSWRMAPKLDANQRMDADKARRRILNIKDDNPWLPEGFDPFKGGDTMRMPFVFGVSMYVAQPRMNTMIYGFSGI